MSTGVGRFTARTKKMDLARRAFSLLTVVGVVSGSGESSESSGRRLDDILTSSSAWVFPSNTQLSFTDASGTSFASGTEVTLSAGYRYKGVAVSSTGNLFPSGSHSSPSIRLAPASVTRAQCATTAATVLANLIDGSSTAGDLGSTRGAVALTVNGDRVEATSINVELMAGGTYRVCYSPDGSFSEADNSGITNNLVPATLTVYGLVPACTTDGCIAATVWNCWFRYKGEGSSEGCVISVNSAHSIGVRTGWSVVAGDQSLLYYSEAYTPEIYDSSSGALTGAFTGKACGSTTPDSTYLSAPASFGLKITSTLAVTLPSPKSTATEPFSVALCYCGNLAGCTVASQFVQNVGTLFMWTAKICDKDAVTACGTRYSRVLPQQEFGLRIDCPPGGCATTAVPSDSRVALVVKAAASRMNWETSANCKVSVENPTIVIRTSSGMNGGSRQDYRAWASGIRLRRSLAQTLEICLCLGSCDRGDSWQKVGEVTTASELALAARTAPTGSSVVSSPVEAISIVNKPGSVSIYSGVSSGISEPVHYAEGPIASNNALLQLVSFDRELVYGGAVKQTLEKNLGLDISTADNVQTKLDSACRFELYSSELVSPGPNTVLTARQYVAVPGSGDRAQYLSFTGETETEAKTMTVKKAGVVGICYCGEISTTSGACVSQAWTFIGRLLIKGPEGGKTWEFPVGTVVGLSIKGWGLSDSDTLRIAPMGVDCSDSGSLVSLTNFKLGCPSSTGDDCITATTAASVAGSVLSSSSTGLFITGVQLSSTRTAFTFSGEVAGLFESGVDLIVLDLGDILIDGLTQSSWSSVQRRAAEQLAGVRTYQDDGTVEYLTGHKVTIDPTNSGKVFVPNVISPNTVAQSSFSFVASSASWRRVNKWNTQEEILGVSAYEEASVCWAAGIDGQYYAKAGTLTFFDPPVIPEISLALTTKKQTTVSPVVLKFTTGSQEYRLNEGKILLTIRLLDVVTGLVPIVNADLSPNLILGVDSPTQLPASASVAQADASQSVCGQLFVELRARSLDATGGAGFPMPLGCYYSSNLRNYGIEEKFYREFSILFEKNYGLRENTEYTIVFLGMTYARAQEEGVQLVEVLSSCADCSSATYKVFERASVGLDSPPVQGAGFSDSAFTPLADGKGFEIINGDANGVLTLSTSNIFRFKLRGSSGAAAIKAGSYLRIYLQPLGLWDMTSGAACSATCVPYSLETQCAGDEMTCEVEGLLAADVGSSEKTGNVVKIRLPTTMTEIDDSIVHTFILTGLSLPSGGVGWLPVRLLAQISNPDDEYPDFISSTGYIMRDSTATSGKIAKLDWSDSGPKPFKQDAGNSAIVRIQLGLPLYSLGQPGAADLTIAGPSDTGMACRVVGTGRVDSSLHVLNQKDAHGYLTETVGQLSTGVSDGSWEGSALSDCVYSLKYGQMIPANTVIFVNVTLENGRTFFAKDDVLNKWYVKVVGKGSGTVGPYAMTSQLFSSAESDYWQGNLAIYGEMSSVSIQPLRFTPGASTQLYMFMQFNVAPKRGATIVVDAPKGFDFSSACTASDLPDYYYVVVPGTSVKTSKLNIITGCTGRVFTTRYSASTSTVYNRAEIGVEGYLWEGRVYGFALSVKLPSSYDASTHTDFKIWSKDADGYGLEGARPPIVFNPRRADSASSGNPEDKGFGIFAASIAGTNTASPSATMSSAKPSFASGAKVYVSIEPIVLAADINANIRLTSPVGFLFDTAMYTVRSNLADTDFPGTPTVTMDNEVVWSVQTLRTGQIYGFEVGVTVPVFGPVSSSNLFFLEIGYDGGLLSQRYYGTSMVAPLVASLYNCQVTTLTPEFAYEANLVRFQFALVTALKDKNGVVIQGDSRTIGFGFVPACTPVPVDGSLPLPSTGRFTCEASKDLNVPKIVMRISGNAASWAPGVYILEFAVTNPPVPSSPGSWTFGSYTSVLDYPQSPVVDQPMTVTGFEVYDALAAAGIVSLSDEQREASGRDDRPNRVNNVIVNFRLASTPAIQSDFVIRAPRGFTFAEECMSGLVIDAAEVFGSPALFPSTQFRTWSATSARPLLCQGDGREMRLTLEPGLQRDSNYVMRIQVTNPAETPAENLWVFEYAGYASDPIGGFTMRTFGSVGLSAISAAVTSAETPQKSPVSFVFSPTLPVVGRNAASGSGRRLTDSGGGGGLLRIEAPDGFSFPAECEGVEVTNTATGVKFDPLEDLACWRATDVPSGSEERWLYVEMAGAKSLVVGQSYQVSFYVVNPSSTVDSGEAVNWWLRSFDSTLTALDEVEVQGYAVVQAMQVFEVENVNDELRGTYTVRGVQISIQLPVQAIDGDVLKITAPDGFDLRGLTAGSCNEFVASTALSSFPSCQCSPADGCTLTITLNEGVVPAIAVAERITFAVTTRNPSTAPALMKSFWRADLLRPESVEEGEEADLSTAKLLTSGVWQVWSIRSQLTGMAIQLIGSLKAAEAMSDLQFKLTPVTQANILKIVANSPTRFDFTNARVDAPASKDALKSRSSTFVATGLVLASGVSTTLTVYNVKLGVVGGQTSFTLETYGDDDLLVLLDETRNYVGGFRLPGRVTVAKKQLKSPAMMQPFVYPVEAQLPPRVEEAGVVEFEVQFSRALFAKQQLVIAVKPASSTATSTYTLKTSGFLLRGSSVVATTQSLTGGQLVVTLSGALESQVVVQANSVYTIQVAVQPEAGEQLWLIQTTDGTLYPTNTNDYLTPGFAPVKTLAMEVSATRSPPRSLIAVQLLFNCTSAGEATPVGSIKVVAPPGFTFPSGSCGPMCTPQGSLLSTARKIAMLKPVTSTTFTQTTDLVNPFTIFVNTPSDEPDSLSWYFEAFGANGASLGWAMQVGFPINPMDNVVVSYPGVSSRATSEGSLLSWFTVSFDLGFPGANRLVIEGPSGYRFKCSLVSYVAVINLPASANPACIQEQPLILQFEQALDPGTYAVGVKLIAPASAPARNAFDVSLVDVNGNVVDAAFNLPGREVVPAYIADPTLSTTGNDPDGDAVVTLSFTAKAEVTIFRAILLQVPSGLLQNVNKPTDIVNVNKALPLAPSNSWYDVSKPETVKIMLDDLEETTTIPPGVYSITFPVQLPRTTPPVNIWHIAFCTTHDCEEPGDALAILDFPVPGFEIGTPLDNLITGFAPAASLSLAALAALLLAIMFN